MAGRRLGVVGGVVVATMVTLAGLAWACTSFIRIESITPGTEQPATTKIEGSGAVAGAAVAVRWNGVEGPVIGQAEADEAGRFSIEAAVPEVPAGLYVLVADDGETPVGRAAIEITPGAATAVSPLPVGSSGPALSTQVGIGLLAGGLVLLAGGFALVTLRQRRVLVPAEVRGEPS